MNTSTHQTLTSASDIELITAISHDRSEKALEELYRRYRPMLRTVIHRVMNTDADCDDVLQDVFIQVWNQASAYSSEKGHLLGWLITMARRRALDRVRQKCAYMNATDRYEKSVERSKPDLRESSVVDQEVQRNELRGCMAKLMQALPEAQRQAVRLSFYQGLSQREISSYLSVPLGTVKTRIELGMRKLGRSYMGAQAA